MGKSALAAALLVLAGVPATAETLPTVVRGSAVHVESAPPPQTQIVTVCRVRINSIGNMPYRHCTTVELSR